MGSSSVSTAARSLLLASSRPAKPEKCRKETRKRLKALKGPKARDGFVFHPDEIERRWLAARCDSCKACGLF